MCLIKVLRSLFNNVFSQNKNVSTCESVCCSNKSSLNKCGDDDGKIPIKKEDVISN